MRKGRPKKASFLNEIVVNDLKMFEASKNLSGIMTGFQERQKPSLTDTNNG